VVPAGIGYGLVNVATNVAVAVAAALPPERHGVGLATTTAGVPGVVTLTSLVVPAVGRLRADGRSSSPRSASS